MDDPGIREAPPGDRDPTRRASAGLVPWALLVMLALVSSVAAVWLYVDRDGLRDELVSSRDRMAELRQVVVDSDERLADLEASLEMQQDEIARREEAIARCRRALEELSEAWEDVMGAVRAAGAIEPEEARALAARADQHRREAARAADECG